MNDEPIEGEQPESPEEEVDRHLEYALEALKAHKPNDRSEKDRHWAITITEMEKVIAFFRTWVAFH